MRVLMRQGLEGRKFRSEPEARGGMKAKAGTPQSPFFAMQSQKVALKKMGSIVPESMLTTRIGKIFAPRAIVCSAKMRYTIYDGCKRKACAACRDRKTY